MILRHHRGMERRYAVQAVPEVHDGLTLEEAFHSWMRAKQAGLSPSFRPSFRTEPSTLVWVQARPQAGFLDG